MAIMHICRVMGELGRGHEAAYERSCNDSYIRIMLACKG